MIKRTLLVLAVATVWATSASAATLSVDSDKLTYSIGETITLSISGDAQGASAFGIYGRLQFDGSKVNNGTRNQKQIGSGWTKGTLEQTDTNAVGPTTASAEAFDQVNIGGGFQTATSPISTVTLLATAFGVVNVIWDVSQGTGFGLTYFGLTNAPGTSFTIVPEPSTMALLALGLVGLAARGVRRQSPDA